MNIFGPNFLSFVVFLIFASETPPPEGFSQGFEYEHMVEKYDVPQSQEFFY